MLKIGAYGGTFDPIHNAHLEVARAVVRLFSLDQMLLIPAHVPPHKEPGSITGSYHRYAMAVLATMDDPSIEVSALELEAPGRPYTFETVETLRDLNGPNAALFFVMGADSFEDLATWREPARVIAAANLVVITRPGHTVDASHLGNDLRQRIRVLGKDGVGELDSLAGSGSIFVSDCVDDETSSTEIRRRVRDGEPIEQLVPDRVAQYIRRYELYRR
jgi:nicotinate-nucleotide adenylyltransferase